MKFFLCIASMIVMALPLLSQNRKMAVIGSSTAAGLAASPVDSAWVNRFNYYYKYQLGVLDSTYNLAVSGSTVYAGMPASYTPPGGRPSPDAAHNVTLAVNQLSDLATPANGCIIVNFPTNGYDGYSIAEIMARLQTIYDSATRTGNKCFITTTQPRSDGSFATSAVKRKLADIKDSIINRFGVAHTLNFWDGMFNPADTTILGAYSAGDNVHFNNTGHRVLFDRVVAKNIFALTATAATGDYRSNVSPTGLWSDASSWQTYNGTSWIAAATAPDASSGVVTILNGDSIRMNNSTTLDQVVVESGGILAIFNSGTATGFTLNDGAGADISVDGKLYVSINATLGGSGTIQNNSGGTFILRNQGILSVNATNNGTMNISGTGNIQNASLTNYGTINLVDFTWNLNNATAGNYGTINISYNANTFIAGTGSGVLINNAGAYLYKSNASGIAQVNASVAFTNTGTVKGIGQYTFSNTTLNTGTIAPGSSPGTLIINPGFVTGASPVIDMEIASTGAVAGTNYDQLQFSTVSSLTANVTGATLRVTDHAADPVGTVYTLLSFPSGTIAGPFANVQLSSSLGNLVYNSNSVTAEKTSVLPLTWGSFTAMAGSGQVRLHWTTLQEVNTAYFTVEYSTDGRRFSDIGSIPAKGNSTVASEYSFIHTTPNTTRFNFYRLRQVDIDGRATYSAVRVVQFNTRGPAVLLYPNPVRDILQVAVQADDITIAISGQDGRVLQRLQLAPGLHPVDIGQLARGIYHVMVYKKQQCTAVYKIIKL